MRIKKKRLIKRIFEFALGQVFSYWNIMCLKVELIYLFSFNHKDICLIQESV